MLPAQQLLLRIRNLSLTSLPLLSTLYYSDGHATRMRGRMLAAVLLLATIAAIDRYLMIVATAGASSIIMLLVALAS